MRRLIGVIGLLLLLVIVIHTAHTIKKLPTALNLAADKASAESELVLLVDLEGTEEKGG